MRGSIEEKLKDHFGSIQITACERVLCRNAAGQLTTQERTAFQAHLATCDECREVLAELAAWPPLKGELFSFRAAVRTTLARRWMRGALALAVFAALIPVGVLTLSRPDRTPRELVAKGGPDLQLHMAVKRGARRFRATDTVTLQTGDLLGFFYTASEERELTILYVDAAGMVSRIYPALSAASAKAAAGAAVSVADGAVVSVGAGCEWALAFFTTDTLGAVDAERTAKQMWEARRDCELGPLDLPGADARVIRIQR